MRPYVCVSVPPKDKHIARLGRATHSRCPGRWLQYATGAPANLVDMCAQRALFDLDAADRPPELVPLAARMRPRSLSEIVGQQHLLAPDRALRKALDADRVPSMLLWGPPGSGKTTLAEV